MIAIAAILDGLDGRVARYLKGTSRFGAELDSLADFLNFGVAPALIIHTNLLHPLKSFGWLIALIVAIATALRLARFNVMADDPKRPEWQKEFFVGMPAPAGAVCALFPLYLQALGVPLPLWLMPFIGAYTAAIALLMVSTLPTFSGKSHRLRLPRAMVLPFFVGVICIVAMTISFPFETLSLLVIAYLSSVPFSIRAYRRHEKEQKNSEDTKNALAQEPENI